MFLSLKAAADRNRQAGAFLLTGSANVLTLPKVADSVAGRLEFLNLRPSSQGKIEGRNENFIDAVCADDFEPSNLDSSKSSEDLFGRMLADGFPKR